MVVIVLVVVSQLSISRAFLYHYGAQRGKSSISSFSKISFCDGVVRSHLPLYASNTNSKSNKRKKQRQKLKQKLSTERSITPGRSLTEDELHSHLNSRINYGKDGPVGARLRSRGVSKKEEVEEESDDVEDKNDKDSRQRQQQFFLRQLANRPTLVLNANYMPLSYMPLSLWSWQDAVKGIFSGKVTVVDVYPDLTVRASNIAVPLPSVIALNDYVPEKNTRPAFTRRNVFLRDEYKCQYCTERFHTHDLSLDHVVPRSMGGLLKWDNAVTCCLKCNGRKGSTPLSKIGSIGMILREQPRCPSQKELAAKSARMIPKRVHPTWKPYLGIQERPAASSIPILGEKGDEEFIDDRYFESD